jgi:hypothetical protein
LRYAPSALKATKGEKVKTAQQASANYRNSAGRAQTAWADGVNNYTGDWAGKTASQKAAWVAGLAAAQARGSWEAGIARVGTGGWKSRTQGKAPNYGVGLTEGAPRFDAAIQKVLSAEQNIVASLPPRGDVNQNIQRAVSVMQQLHALKGTLGA